MTFLGNFILGNFDIILSPSASITTGVSVFFKSKRIALNIRIAPGSWESPEPIEMTSYLGNCDLISPTGTQTMSGVSEATLNNTEGILASVTYPQPTFSADILDK